MKRTSLVRITAFALALMAGSALVRAEDKSPMAVFMKQYHSAPKGTDPVCKRAIDGKASKEELKKLVEGYALMAKTKAPKGDAASWKEKTTALLEASKSLQKGDADGAAKYKEAVNCKACHSVHKPD